MSAINCVQYPPLTSVPLQAHQLPLLLMTTSMVYLTTAGMGTRVGNGVGRGGGCGQHQGGGQNLVALVVYGHLSHGGKQLDHEHLPHQLPWMPAPGPFGESPAPHGISPPFVAKSAAEPKQHSHGVAAAPVAAADSVHPCTVPAQQPHQDCDSFCPCMCVCMSYAHPINTLCICAIRTQIHRYRQIHM